MLFFSEILNTLTGAVSDKSHRNIGLLELCFVDGHARVCQWFGWVPTHELVAARRGSDTHDVSVDVGDRVAQVQVQCSLLTSVNGDPHLRCALSGVHDGTYTH